MVEYRRIHEAFDRANQLARDEPYNPMWFYMRALCVLFFFLVVSCVKCRVIKCGVTVRTKRAARPHIEEKMFRKRDRAQLMVGFVCTTCGLFFIMIQIS